MEQEELTLAKTKTKLQELISILKSIIEGIASSNVSKTDIDTDINDCIEILNSVFNQSVFMAKDQRDEVEAALDQLNRALKEVNERRRKILITNCCDNMASLLEKIQQNSNNRMSDVSVARLQGQLNGPIINRMDSRSDIEDSASTGEQSLRQPQADPKYQQDFDSGTEENFEEKTEKIPDYQNQNKKQQCECILQQQEKIKELNEDKKNLPVQAESELRQIMQDHLIDEIVSKHPQIQTQIKGQVGIMVVASRMSGKTSFSNFLAEKRVDSDAQQEHSKKLPQPKTSSNNSHEQQRDEQQQQTESSSNKIGQTYNCIRGLGNKVIIDTPSLQKNLGDAMEIGNTLTLQEIVSNCSKIFFILLISYDQLIQPGAQCLQELYQFLDHLVKNLENNIQHIQIFFTKVPQGVHQNDLIGALKKIQVKPTGNKNISNFLQAIIKKAQTDEARKLNLEKCFPDNIWSKIDKIQQNFISKEQINTQLSNQSYKTIQIYLNQQNQVIDKFTRKCLFENVNLFFDRKLVLHKLTHEQVFIDDYGVHRKVVLQIMKKNIEADQEILGQSIASDRKLSNEQYSKFKELFFTLEAWDQNKTKHFQDSSISLANFVEYIKQKINILISNLQNSATNFDQKIVMIDKLEQLSFIQSHYFEEYFKAGKQIIYNHLVQIYEDYKNQVFNLFSLSTHDTMQHLIQEIAQKRQMLMRNEQVVKQWIIDINLYNESQKYFLGETNSAYQSSIQELELIIDINKKHDYGKAKRLFQLLRKVADNQKQLGFQDELKAVFKKVRGKFADSIQSLHQTIKTILDKTKVNVLVDIKYAVDAFKELRTLDKIVQDRTEEYFKHQVGLICKLINDLKQKIKEIYTKVKAKDSKNSEKFITNMKILLSISAWIDNYTDQRNDNAIQFYSKYLSKFQKLLRKNIILVQKAFNPNEHMEEQKLQQMEEQFQQYSNYYNLFLEVTNSSKEITQIHSEFMKNHLKMLQDYSGSNFDELKRNEIKRILKAYQDLNKLKLPEDKQQIYKDKQNKIINQIIKKIKAIDEKIKSYVALENFKEADKIYLEYKEYSSDFQQYSQEIQNFAAQISELQAYIDGAKKNVDNQIQFKIEEYLNSPDPHNIKMLAEYLTKKNLNLATNQLAKNSIEKYLQMQHKKAVEYLQNKKFIDFNEILNNYAKFSVIQTQVLPQNLQGNILDYQNQALDTIVLYLSNFQIMFIEKQQTMTDSQQIFGIMSLMVNTNFKIQQEEQKYQKIKTQLKELQEKIYNVLNDLTNLYETKKNTLIDIESFFLQLNRIQNFITTFQELDAEKMANPLLLPLLKDMRQRIPVLLKSSDEIKAKVSALEPQAYQLWAEGKFDQVNSTLELIKNSLGAAGYIGSSTIDYPRIIQNFSNNINSYSDEIEKLVDKQIFTEDLNKLLSKLDQIGKEINCEPSLKKVSLQWIERANRNLNTILSTRSTSLKIIIDQMNENRSTETNHAIARGFIEIIRISDKVPIVCEPVSQHIESGLNYYKQKLKIEDLFGLAMYFKNSGGPLGAKIVQQFSTFKSFNYYELKQLTKDTHNAQYVLDKMRFFDSASREIKQLTQQQTTLLTGKYQIFDQTYKSLLEQNMLNNQRLEDIHKEIKNILNKSQLSLRSWNEKAKDQANILLAYVFVFWAFQDMEDSQKGSENINAQDFLRFPHAIQVISIMITLGFNKADTLPENEFELENEYVEFKQNIDNLLIQLYTGQGKSVVLGVTSIIFGLLGYEVDIACYSAYLSARDRQSFSKIFIQLGLEQMISYGTIDQLADHVMNLDVDMSQKCHELVENSKIEKAEVQQRMRLLLIDEVDVFFNKDFYGKTYNPVKRFKCPEIKMIMTEIWRLRQIKEMRLLQEEIIKLPSYSQLMNKYSYWRELFENHILLMISQVKLVDDHQYVIKDGRIFYKTHDTLSDKISYGYKTNFSYFKERENGKVSQEYFEDNICINLACGNFSYASIFHTYDHRIGVTGTLEKQHDSMKNLMQQYISQQYYAPSMFGEGHLDFQKQNYTSIAEDLRDQCLLIKEKTREKLDNQQAVLIFFRNKNQLLEYYNSQYLTDAERQTYKILDETSENVQDIVEKATRCGSVTLIVRDFGRGTDFRCNDKQVNNNGGVVAIQTFFSQDENEEVQLQGRVARQSEKGQFYLIMLSRDLEEDFSLPISDIRAIKQNSANIYDELSKIRKQRWGEYLQTHKDSINPVQEIHEMTVQLKSALLSGDSEGAKMKLLHLSLQDIKKKIPCPEGLHFIFVIDRSGSMNTIDDKNDGKTRFDKVVLAVESFIQSRLDQTYGRGSDFISIITYDHEAQIVNKYNQLRTIDQSFKENKPIHGNTIYALAINKILELLQGEIEECQKLKKMVLFLSDGEDKSPPEVIDKKLDEFIAQYGKHAAWWNMGFGPEAEIGRLKQMTEKLEKANCSCEYKTAITAADLKEQFVELAQVSVQMMK